MAESEYVIEMLNITKEFPGIRANDNITLQLKRGEIHALLGENGAGKSTLMSVLFGLYQPESGVIKKNGQVVKISDPNDANDLNIGMVHQHFKLVECFSVLDNIILGVEPNKAGFLQKKQAREKVVALSHAIKSIHFPTPWSRQHRQCNSQLLHLQGDSLHLTQSVASRTHIQHRSESRCIFQDKRYSAQTTDSRRQ